MSPSSLALQGPSRRRPWRISRVRSTALFWFHSISLRLPGGLMDPDCYYLFSSNVLPKENKHQRTKAFFIEAEAVSSLRFPPWLEKKVSSHCYFSLCGLGRFSPCQLCKESVHTSFCWGLNVAVSHFLGAVSCLVHSLQWGHVLSAACREAWRSRRPSLTWMEQPR